MSLKELELKSKTFEEEGFEGVDEEGRLSFIKRFPINSINELTIDQYVQGTDDNSFCYWLEFKPILFGIGGGSASKFGLYKARDGKYYASYGKNKEPLSGKELSDHFKRIVDGIVRALAFTKADEIEKIKDLDIPVWNMVIQKILSIYYPEKFLTIGAPDVLLSCARDINIKGIELKAENSIQINYECKKALSNLEVYKNWSYQKLGAFIWDVYYPESKRSYYILGSKYGEDKQTDIFPELYNKSIIATGFAWNLNLEEYYLKNHSEIKKHLQENGEPTNSINALKYFLNLKLGDRLAIKADGSPKGSKGFLSIVGIAEVIEKNGEVYHHDPDGLGHTINVKYLKAPVYKEFDLGGYGRTIHKLSKQDHIDLIFDSEYQIRPLETIQPDHKEAYSEWISRKYDKNSGTANSYIKALDILSVKIGYDIYRTTDRIKLNELYKDLKKEQKNTEGKYFHQDAPSYGDHGFYSASVKTYIEFLEEFYSKTPLNDQIMNHPLNTILYGPPGTGKTYNTVQRAAEIITNKKIESYSEALRIFKENLHDRIEFITFHQNYSYEDFIQGLRPDIENDKELTFERKDGVFKIMADKALKNILESEQPKTFTKSFEEVFNKFINPLIEGEIEEIEVKMKKVSYFITAITNKSIDFRKASGGTAHTLSIATLKKMYDAESILNIQGLSSYYNPLLKELLALGKDSKGRIEEIPRKNFVIIIDEINRANISRVFGELITLIEPDKRSNGEIPMEARLPSGDPFIVPSNLYIIGTMNTADKSIALLDIALRRRFEFVAMYPEYSLPNNTIHDVDILKKINKEIIKSKGYDFQIGHAYFMGENDDLVERMNKKVIPLLLEYYMNDEKEVKGILSIAGLKIVEDKWPIQISGKSD